MTNTEEIADRMLSLGEEIGTGNGQRVDIALDPLEGTTLTAKDMPNTKTVFAMGPHGSVLHAPDVYRGMPAIDPVQRMTNHQSNS